MNRPRHDLRSVNGLNAHVGMKMTFRTMIFALLTMTLAACASRDGAKPATQLTPDVSAVVGTWTADVVGRDSNVIERSFTIRDDSVVLETICRENDKVVSVKVTSPAIVTPSAITVLRAEERVKAAGSEVCQSRLDRGVIKYQIKDGALVLNPEGKSAFVFGRKDKTFPSAESESDREAMKLLGQII